MIAGRVFGAHVYSSRTLAGAGHATLWLDKARLGEGSIKSVTTTEEALWMRGKTSSSIYSEPSWPWLSPTGYVTMMKYYHSSAGVPRLLQWTVPESADPCGLRALLLLAEQPERVFPGWAVPESRGGWRLQWSHERHRRGPAFLPKGHRFPHSQFTARHLLVKTHQCNFSSDFTSDGGSKLLILSLSKLILQHLKLLMD